MILPAIDKTWTLFIDRDGVINHEKKEDYILNWNEFVFYDGVKEAMKTLNPLFNRIVMVTNQKGVGRGLMSLNDLENIHVNMLSEIEATGGRVDHIFFCSDINNDSPNRKPNPGMALQAKEKYPEIDFSKSIMVGNKISDMEFGRNAGIHTVFVATTNPETAFPHPSVDFRFNDLLDFAQALTK
ncbi:MAG: HAD family hydrolase [Sphingobacteriia bacterium]|nr:HAD family hydrolase [Sphingobacteriia bacterium]